MNPNTHNLTVRGQRVRTRTPRRFAVVTGRSHPLEYGDGSVLVPFARVEKRTDSLQTARDVCRRRGYIAAGVWMVIIDLNTGGEVS